MKFYLSHSIRGKHGKNATPVQMKENCDEIISIANTIRKKVIVDLYVPAEHEFPPVGYFLQKGFVTIQQVLEIDCDIINECDGVIIYAPPDDPIQGGRAIELKHAQITNKPICIFRYVDCAIDWLAQQIVRA